MNAETAADFASDLYSHLDSSGGDYNDIQEELSRCENIPSVQKMTDAINRADAKLTEAFEILDEVILPAIEYMDGHGEFTDDVQDEVQKVFDLVLIAENAVEEGLEASKTVSEEAVYSEFSFGVHSDPESSFNYLHGDVDRMLGLANEMERKY